jgi:hypothetical protein
MQQLAGWLYDTYSAYLLELIHSGGTGYFVKDGKRVPASYYGASTVSQHYDHVHVAMTLSGIAAARGINPTGTVNVADTQGSALGGNGGCALPAVLLLAGVGSGVFAVIEGAIHVFGS